MAISHLRNKQGQLTKIIFFISLSLFPISCFASVEWKYHASTKNYEIYTNISSRFLSTASKIAEQAYEKAVERLDAKNNDKEFIKTIERNIEKMNKNLINEWEDGTRQYQLNDGIILNHWQHADDQYQIVLPDGRKFSFWERGMYGQKVNIYLCKDKDELKRNIEKSVEGTGRGGWYIVEGKISYEMVYKEEYKNLDNLAHEISHQITDYILYDPPVWLNEGLAMYAGINSDGEYEEGLIRPDHLNECVSALNNDSLVNVGSLIKMNYDKYHNTKNESLHYSESWALVHMLLNSRHSSVKGKFIPYLTDLRKGIDPMTAFNKHYDIKVIEKGFPKYIEWLKSKSNQ